MASAPLEIYLCNPITMHSCNSCGKGIETEWNSCPFCSTPIGGGTLESSTRVSDTIIDEIQNADQCASCGSRGVTQIACSGCGKMSHCNVCEREISSSRRTKRKCLACDERDIRENIRKKELEAERLAKEEELYWAEAETFDLEMIERFWLQFQEYNFEMDFSTFMILKKYVKFPSRFLWTHDCKPELQHQILSGKFKTRGSRMRKPSWVHADGDYADWTDTVFTASPQVIQRLNKLKTDISEELLPNYNIKKLILKHPLQALKSEAFGFVIMYLMMIVFSIFMGFGIYLEW